MKSPEGHSQENNNQSLVLFIQVCMKTNFCVEEKRISRYLHEHQEILREEIAKGAVINYDREGGGSISENSQKNFKPPPIQEIKIQTPSRFQRIISDPNTSFKRENIHILVSNACHSIWPSVIVQDLSHYLWLIQFPRIFKKTRCQVKISP